MNIRDSETKDKMIQRLRKIEGQVRGIQGMLDEERDCREIMQQLSAIHSAVEGVSRVFLQEYAVSCLAELDEGEGSKNPETRMAKRGRVVNEMLSLLDKAP